MAEPAAPAPLVSVICIFLDEERFLREAVDSVLAQEMQDFELILVDDGSRDGSCAMARDYAAQHPGRIVALDHPGHANRGKSVSRNRALDHARGRFVAFIDGDDVWLPGKLARQVALMEAHPAAGLVCGMVTYWNSWDGGEDQYEQTGGVGDAVLSPPDLGLSIYPLGGAHAVTPSDMLVRREVFDRIGGFIPEFTDHYEDQAFLAKLYLTTPIYCASERFFLYRQHYDMSVARVLREGQYFAGRRKLLHWLEGWMTAHDFPGKPALMKRVRIERWKVDHLFVMRVVRRLKRAWQALFG